MSLAPPPPGLAQRLRLPVLAVLFLARESGGGVEGGGRGWSRFGAVQRPKCFNRETVPTVLPTLSAWSAVHRDTWENTASGLSLPQSSVPTGQGVPCTPLPGARYRGPFLSSLPVRSSGPRGPPLRVLHSCYPITTPCSRPSHVSYAVTFVHEVPGGTKTRHLGKPEPSTWGPTVGAFEAKNKNKSR